MSVPCLFMKRELQFHSAHPCFTIIYDIMSSFHPFCLHFDFLNRRNLKVSFTNLSFSPKNTLFSRIYENTDCQAFVPMRHFHDLSCAL